MGKETKKQMKHDNINESNVHNIDNKKNTDKQSIRIADEKEEEQIPILKVITDLKCLPKYNVEQIIDKWIEFYHYDFLVIEKTFLFELGFDCLPLLKEDGEDSALKQAFSDHKVQLSDKAQLIRKEDGSWEINDNSTIYGIEVTDKKLIINKIGSLYNYAAKISTTWDQIDYNDSAAVYIDFWDLDKWDHLFLESLMDTPYQVLVFAADAAQQLLSSDQRVDLYKKELNIRLKNVPKVYQVKIGNVVGKHIGKYIQIRGRTDTISSHTIKMLIGHWRCRYCDFVTKIVYKEDDHDLISPITCNKPAGGCGKSGNIFELLKKPSSKTNFQTIDIEEPFDMIDNQQPQKLKCFFYSDLVGKVFQAQDIIINGIVDIFQEYGKKKATNFQIGLIVNSFEMTTVKEELVWTAEEEQKFIELSKDPDGEKKIMDSICPDIICDEQIKKALLLQIVSPNAIILPDGSYKRGKINIGLCGDPATGKTDLMIWIMKLHPIRIFVSGTDINHNGLTASTPRNDLLGKNDLIPGAAPKANGGILVMDECDKTDEDELTCLNIPMEQGYFPVTKGGYNLVMQTNDSFLFGMNPKYRKFNDYQPIQDQITLKKDTTSRLDLLIAMRDIPNPKKDAAIAATFFDTYAGISKISNAPLSYDFLKKYIYYVLKQPDPALTIELKDYLLKKYLELRGKGDDVNSPLQITIRQMGALIRLTLANAKLFLRKKPEIVDAIEAYDIFSYSMNQNNTDGEWDILKQETGVSFKENSRLETVKMILRSNASGIAVTDLLVTAEQNQITKIDALTILDKLEKFGDIYQYPPGVYCIRGR